MNSELFPSPPHSFERLLQNACCGLPQLHGGSLDERQCGRPLLGVIVVLDRQLLCGQPPRNCHRNQSGASRLPRTRFLRALRPSICKSCPFYLPHSPDIVSNNRRGSPAAGATENNDDLNSIGRKPQKEPPIKTASAAPKRSGANHCMMQTGNKTGQPHPDKPRTNRTRSRMPQKPTSSSGPAAGPPAGAEVLRSAAGISTSCLSISWQHWRP